MELRGAVLTRELRTAYGFHAPVKDPRTGHPWGKALSIGVQ